MAYISKNSRKYLVIVESPSKVHLIEKYLGSEYEVIASKGHICNIEGLKDIGIAGLYMIKKQDEQKKESFENLPNTNIPDVNYPTNQESDTTSLLSTQNKYKDSSTYTDKYFKPSNIVSSSVDKYKSLTGQTVDMSYFRHNNMAPFFGSKSHSNNSPNETESQLDHQNGSGSQHISKKEQSPMFSPGQNIDWTHGMPSSTDFIQSRVNPSNKLTGIKPFEQIQVGPGLGLGSNIKVSNDGLNNGMIARDKWIDKNVDELRAKNKQKASGLGMLGYEGPAKSYETERGNIGIVENNRVNKTFEMGQDRLLTTTGLEKGHTLRPIQVERNVNRPATDYVGAAGHTNTSHQTEGMSEYRQSRNIQLGSLPLLPAYAAGKRGAYDADYGSNSTISYNNNRTISNETQSYYGALGGTFGSLFSPILDVLKPSRRENTIRSLRPYQNAKTPVSSSYVYNPHDKPETTNREMTENSKYHMNINGSRSGGHQTTNVNMLQTIKETTNNNDFVGNAQSAYLKPRTYDAEYSQESNNLKSSVINGRLVQGNMKLMNSNINMISKDRETTMLNVRPSDRKLSTQIPDINSMGIVQGNTFGSNLVVQTDRTDGSVLKQLHDNPFNQNILSGL
jgi:Family of unknown function (DUF5899)/Toprim domain